MSTTLPACSSVVSLLRFRALREADSAAYTFLADGETVRDTVTYGVVDRRARAIAATLQAHRLFGERVLLLCPPGLDYVAAFFGCLYAGVIAVPAYPPRRHRSVERLRAIVTDARATAIIATPAVASDAVRAATAGAVSWPLQWLTSDQFAEQAADGWREPEVTAPSVALLQYTSGSTATPRGVMITHGNLLHNCRWVQQRFGHTPQSRGVIWLPPYHDMGLIGGIVQPLYAGLHCYLMSPVSFFSSPIAWLQAISRFRATTSGGPNFAYDLCVRRITAEQRATLDLGCWEVAFCGAEPIRADTLERFAETFAPCGFRRESFYPCYGLAEATVMATGGAKMAPLRTLTVEKSALESNEVRSCPAGNSGSQTLVGCGHSLDDQRIVIVDPESQRPCAASEIGEIWISGPSVAPGYWDKAEESQATFGARLADSGDGPFLRTGDLGFLDGGELYVTGRLKDLIIYYGRNLYPQDLEQAAELAHPDLQPGCAAAFAVEHAGQEHIVLAGEAVPRRSPDVEAVAEVVRRAIAEEHDAELHAFVLLKPGSLPRTSSGKTQRRACRTAFLMGTLEMLGQWRAGGPASGSSLSRAALSILPTLQRKAALEAYFRAQVARLVHVPVADIDVRQPINTLGLDSLASVEIKNALEGTLGIALPVSSFLQGACIGELAAEVSNDLSVPETSIGTQPVAKLGHEIRPLSDDRVQRLLHDAQVPAGGTLP